MNEDVIGPIILFVIVIGIILAYIVIEVCKEMQYCKFVKQIEIGDIYTRLNTDNITNSTNPFKYYYDVLVIKQIKHDVKGNLWVKAARYEMTQTENGEATFNKLTTADYTTYSLFTKNFKKNNNIYIKEENE
jgi:hypothetical protein